MKIEIKYSGSIINLPLAVADIAPKASKIDLQVIICISGYFEYFTKFEQAIPLIANRLTVSSQDVQSSLLFWMENGILSIEGAEEFETKMVGGTRNEVPSYTGKQVARFVDKNKKIQELFYECQMVMGKEFNKHDHDCIIYLKETFRFSDGYIVLLIAHCVEVGKGNWAYIKKLASELYDQGITTYKKLEAHFADRKNKNSLEYKVRKLLGIGNAEFTTKQRAIFEKWVENDISFEMIKLAYEITVDTTGKASMPYMAKIIENWISSGIKTVKQAKEAQEKYTAKKQKARTPSYGDADDFFETALARSYDDDEENDK